MKFYPYLLQYALLLSNTAFLKLELNPCSFLGFNVPCLDCLCLFFFHSKFKIKLVILYRVYGTVITTGIVRRLS